MAFTSHCPEILDALLPCPVRNTFMLRHVWQRGTHATIGTLSSRKLGQQTLLPSCLSFLDSVCQSGSSHADKLNHRDVCPSSCAHDPRAIATYPPFQQGRGICTSLYRRAALPEISVEQFLVELREAEKELQRCKRNFDLDAMVYTFAELTYL
jgi:hypothetical protein